MEKSIEEATVGMDIRSLSTRVRRRLIQSTLFPHKPPDNTAAEGEDCEKDEDHEDGDEECCGSQNKKKRQRKPKAVSKSRVSKKVAVNGKETPDKGIDEEDSPLNGKDTKRPQQGKRRASATPEKRRRNTTPKKKLNNILNEGCSGQMSNNLILSEPSSLQIPDLRLEAKMKAEENSRIFAGRQIHPFFSCWKMGKGNQRAADGESKRFSIDGKDINNTLNPIHVFEQVQDDDFSPEWGNWVFRETSSESTSGGLVSKPLSIYEGSIKSLRFDSFCNNSGPTTTSCQNDGTSDHCSVPFDNRSLYDSAVERDYILAVSSTLSADKQVINCERSSEREVNPSTSKDNICAMEACSGQNSDVECLEKMINASGHGCGNQTENSLWTNKYQPGKATEICGNGRCVDILNDWLRLWREKSSRTSMYATNGSKCVSQDFDDCYTSETDSEDIDEENSLKNVLLVTGPVGSGKSAAIYACAKEQGFRVIEVNASDWRNGALVKQRFGEAVESQWLQCSMENPEMSDIKHLFKSFPASVNAASAQVSDCEVIELIPLSDDDISPITRMTSGNSVSKGNRTSDQSGVKTLILFEDVDATFYEDRGFVTTIQQLAATAKRPMILTSNRDDPVLPNNLDRLEVRFSKPSQRELLGVVSRVCSAEKVDIQPCLVERFIGFCEGDIRKTILHLQFWCQGQNDRKDKQVHCAYGPMVFDPDAGHKILPKIISNSCPSQLSEIVEKEITKSLLELEETASLLEILKDEEADINGSMMYKIEPNSIEAKKEAMLNIHFSDQDGNELPVQFSNDCGFSDSSRSPIAFGRRRVQRRFDAVLSSDSGEECLSEGFPTVTCKLPADLNDDSNVEVCSKAPSYCLAPELSLNPSTKQLIHSQRESTENCYPCTVMSNCSLLNGTCRSIDVSVVPESSFVPETELFSEAVSCGDVDNTAETAFTDGDFPVKGIHLDISPSRLHEIPIFQKNKYDLVTESVQEEVEVAGSRIHCTEITTTRYDFTVNEIDLNVFPTELHEIPVLLGNSNDLTTEFVQDEEVADSHIECVPAVPRENQGMDECSRMNFSRRLKSKKKSSSLMACDIVQEKWKKLRHCHKDLQQFATLEDKDTSEVLKLAYKMSNLISEADMLLSDCQLLTCDNLKPSMVPCEKSHSYSWYDDQLKMVSTISEHGMCLYAKDVDTVNSNKVSGSQVDLAYEMLASSTNSIALGKLVNQNKIQIQGLEMGTGISSQSELASSLHGVVQSLVPSRSFLSIEGNALHEYLSSLSQISRSEASRLSESLNNSRKRRARVARNYLTTGSLSLSPEDISLLEQYNCYQKVKSQSMDSSLR